MTLKREFRDELGYIAPPNRKLPPVPGSNYNTCDRLKRGEYPAAAFISNSYPFPLIHSYIETIINAKQGDSRLMAGKVHGMYRSHC